MPQSPLTHISGQRINARLPHEVPMFRTVLIRTIAAHLERELPSV